MGALVWNSYLRWYGVEIQTFKVHMLTIQKDLGLYDVRL